MGGISIISDLIGDFRAGGPEETAILAQIQRFVAQHGEAALSSEIAGEYGHLTASSWISNPENTQVLLVFARKFGVWQLPGAHCENDGDLRQTARNAASHALGTAPQTSIPPLWALGAREISEYWNTPAHSHFELVFRFIEPEGGHMAPPLQMPRRGGPRARPQSVAHQNTPLPRGAKWFSLQEVAALGDETLARWARKSLDCGP